MNVRCDDQISQMKTKKSVLTVLLTLLFISFLFVGCNDENSIVDPNNNNDEVETLKKIAEEDELITINGHCQFCEFSMTDFHPSASA